MELTVFDMKFIAQREACVLVPYPDGDHYSVGYGHNGPDVSPDSPAITPFEALMLFKQDLKPRVRSVNIMLGWRPIKQYQFGALVSGYYQAGSQMRPVCDLLNSNREDEALSVWCSIVRESSQPKRFKPGLAKRRWQETHLYWNGDYGDLTTLKLFRGLPRLTKVEEIPFPVEFENAA